MILPEEAAFGLVIAPTMITGLATGGEPPLVGTDRVMLVAPTRGSRGEIAWLGCTLEGEMLSGDPMTYVALTRDNGWVPVEEPW